MNFDPRRAAGNQVILFSCGGRADGEGLVTDSQLFSFTDGNGALPLVPANGQGKIVLTVKGNALDQTSGDSAKASGDQVLIIWHNYAVVASKNPIAFHIWSWHGFSDAVTIIHRSGSR
jgi:hypothetical protein